MNGKYTLKFTAMDDLPSYMDLVRLVRDNFPGLDTEEEMEKHRQYVIKCIARGSAICVTQGQTVVGVLVFSPRQNCLSCLAVHPDHRRQGIASALVEKVLSLLDPGRDVWVSTFREEDDKGTAPRALYRKYGFAGGELTTEFGYPHQKFILYR